VNSDESTILVCADCGVEAEREAREWRAYQDCDDNVVTFGAECAAREFDQH
jgi:hypothetical protein